MSALLVQFPLKKAICIFCMSQFDRRANEPGRCVCPECREELRCFHEQAEDCRKILEESLRVAGVDDPAAAIERHIDDLLEGMR